jgi:DNA-directed RNA polymerase specialized sigma24 family protein
MSVCRILLVEGGAVSVQSRLSSVPGQDPQRLVAGGDLASFTDLFRARAAHVFDYCNCLLGDDGEAADATAATFITAHSLLGRLRDPDRVDAWLFALARRECKSKRPARAELGGGGPPPAQSETERAFPAASASSRPAFDRDAVSLAEADTDELNAIVDAADDKQAREVLAAFSALPVSDREVLAAFSALRPRDREVLDLVYWHGIRPAELPAILGITAQQAYKLLTAAVKRFRSSAERVHASVVRQGNAVPSSGDDLLAAMPTASLPTSVWYRTARTVFEPEFRGYYRVVAAHAGPLRADGFPAQATTSQGGGGGRTRAVGMAAAVLVPVLAGAAAVAYAAKSTPGTPLPRAGTTVTQTGHGSGLTHSARKLPGKQHAVARPSSSLFPTSPGHSVPPVYVPTGPTTGTTGDPNPAPSSHHPSSGPTTRPPTVSSSPAPSVTVSSSPSPSNSSSSTPTSAPASSSSPASGGSSPSPGTDPSPS